ncbi:proline racemase family protein [Roseobacteraceae bacterium S113]
MRSTRMITAVEAHAEGEGGRVITGGMPPLKGASVYEKMRDLATNHDHIRTLMLQEPRGNPALCCNVLVPPCDPSADAGFIIMEQSEYAPMSGSNTICVVTVLLETGILPMSEPETRLRLEVPAGLIDVTATCRDGKVERVEFLNVPAFAAHVDVPLEVPGFGEVRIDIAWGGMWFVQAEAAQFALDPTAANGARIVAVAEAVRRAALARYPVVHPDNPGLTGPTITALTAPPNAPGTDGRGAIVLSTEDGSPRADGAATGVLDRSPCGTGTCAKLAVLHAKGLLAPGTPYVNAGPPGTTFTGEIVETTQVGPYSAIRPKLSGRGWIYGVSQYLIDPSDPFPTGFTVGDIWG